MDQSVHQHKVIHLKLNMVKRTILRNLIARLQLPEKAMERIILNFVGMKEFDMSHMG